MAASKGWALVTGASAGIGAVIADRLAAEGYDLLLVARQREPLEAAAQRIREASGRQVQVKMADLSIAGWAERVLDGVPDFKVLVNNAGRGDFGEFEKQDGGRLSGTVILNCISPMELCLAAIPKMRRQGGGVIVNIGSLAGYLPVPYFAVYAATKAFLNSLSIALDIELRGTGIRVCNISPGGVNTNFHRVAGVGDRIIEDFGSTMSSPEDVADEVLKSIRAPRTIFMPGFLNRLNVRIMKFMSPVQVAKLAAKLYKRYLK